MGCSQVEVVALLAPLALEVLADGEHINDLHEDAMDAYASTQTPPLP